MVHDLSIGPCELMLKTEDQKVAVLEPTLPAWEIQSFRGQEPIKQDDGELREVHCFRRIKVEAHLSACFPFGGRLDSGQSLAMWQSKGLEAHV